MANIQIRDVPDHIHQELLRRAENSGKSLQQFLMGQLVILVDRPDIEEILSDIRKLPKIKISSADIVQMVREERARS